MDIDAKFLNKILASKNQKNIEKIIDCEQITFIPDLQHSQINIYDIADD
jgi:hypothetical protein